MKKKSRSRSVVKDCFTGQSPGKAISIPAAPDVQRNQARSKPYLLRGGLGELAGGGWTTPSKRSWLIDGASPSTVLASVAA